MNERPPEIRHYSELKSADNSHYPGSDELLSIGSNFGKAFGFEKLGIHHEILPPGRRTSYPHSESDEEEFVYVIEGHPEVWINGKRYPLYPGDGVGFKSGTGICHTFINDTDTEVRLLVVGEKSKPTNKIYYSHNPERKPQVGDSWWIDWPVQSIEDAPCKPKPVEEVDLFRRDLILEGDKLTLRSAQAGDYESLRILLSDPLTMSELKYLSHFETGGWTLEEIRERYEGRLEGRGQKARLDFVMVSRKTNNVIGHCGFNHVDRKHRAADFGIIIHHPFWGQGFSAEAHYLCLTYAFESLKLHRVDFSTFTTNSKMRKFFEKMGASLESSRKESFLIDGQFKDDVIYRILETDWPDVKTRLKKLLKL